MRNEGGRVLDEAGGQIPGLLVAGEMLGGLFSGNYPGGSGLMSGAVFGRIAGAAAAGGHAWTASVPGLQRRDSRSS